MSYSSSHVRKQFGKPRRSSLWTMSVVYVSSVLCPLSCFTEHNEDFWRERPCEVAVQLMSNVSQIVFVFSIRSVMRSHAVIK
jgi:hypothetical protein